MTTLLFLPSSKKTTVCVVKSMVTTSIPKTDLENSLSQFCKWDWKLIHDTLLNSSKTQHPSDWRMCLLLPISSSLSWIGQLCEIKFIIIQQEQFLIASPQTPSYFCQFSLSERTAMHINEELFFLGCYSILEVSSFLWLTCYELRMHIAISHCHFLIVHICGASSWIFRGILL